MHPTFAMQNYRINIVVKFYIYFLVYHWNFCLNQYVMLLNRFGKVISVFATLTERVICRGCKMFAIIECGGNSTGRRG